MVGRGELTDRAWAQLEPLLPRNQRRGGRWRQDGTWDRLLARAQTKSDAVGELEWVVCVDSSSVRAHQHAAGARKRPVRADAKGGRSVTRPRRSAGPGAG